MGSRVAKKVFSIFEVCTTGGGGGGTKNPYERVPSHYKHRIQYNTDIHATRWKLEREEKEMKKAHSRGSSW